MTDLVVRRARRADVPAMAALVRSATAGKHPVDEAQVLDWLFGKGVLIALRGDQVAGMATWQAENLLSVTDHFYIYPARLRPAAGALLLATIEAEANVLMCEANVLTLPPDTPKALRTFLLTQGYEPRTFPELHRIWRQVLAEYMPAQPDLVVKRLREKMVMAPI